LLWCIFLVHLNEFGHDTLALCTVDSTAIKMHLLGVP
jgi:hypothetical protein